MNKSNRWLWRLASLPVLVPMFLVLSPFLLFSRVVDKGLEAWSHLSDGD